MELSDNAIMTFRLDLSNMAVIDALFTLVYLWFSAFKIYQVSLVFVTLFFSASHPASYLYRHFGAVSFFANLILT